jgi:hypothetical protein
LIQNKYYDIINLYDLDASDDADIMEWLEMGRQAYAGVARPEWLGWGGEILMPDYQQQYELDVARKEAERKSQERLAGVKERRDKALEQKQVLVDQYTDDQIDFEHFQSSMQALDKEIETLEKQLELEGGDEEEDDEDDEETGRDGGSSGEEDEDEVSKAVSQADVEMQEASPPRKRSSQAGKRKRAASEIRVCFFIHCDASPAR